MRADAITITLILLMLMTVAVIWQFRLGPADPDLDTRQNLEKRIESFNKITVIGARHRHVVKDTVSYTSKTGSDKELIYRYKGGAALAESTSSSVFSISRSVQEDQRKRNETGYHDNYFSLQDKMKGEVSNVGQVYDEEEQNKERIHEEDVACVKKSHQATIGKLRKEISSLRDRLDSDSD